jgi:pimeloyl-ACP methyl ester carboxylesterase
MTLPEESDGRLEIRQAVAKRWEQLQRMANAESPQEAPAMQAVVDQIVQQFQGLRTPWMKYFLAYDPAKNWLLFDCPTLAVWGERDVQVLPELNRERAIEIIERNYSLKADLVILPELNHLFQRATTGLPEEYETIRETVDPSLLETLRAWLQQRQLLP